MTSTTIIEAGAAGDGIEVAIRREHEAASSAARTALDHALECGRLLAQARAGIAHGGWESFVRERCGIPERTARMYLRLDAHRDRLPNRQHVAGLTVREAVRALAEPRVKAEAGARPAFDYLGNSFWYCSMTSTSCEFNSEWRTVPFPVYAKEVADRFGVEAPAPPSWYAAGHRHAGHHASGWCFEVTPDPDAEGRVNVIAHDAEGTLHLATFDGASPAGILPFLTACERHHGMPVIGDGWTITAVPMSPAAAKVAEPFQAGIFRLAGSRGHRCCCWMLLDVALGIEPIMDGSFALHAWVSLGAALGKLLGPGKPLGQFDNGASMWWLGDWLNHGSIKRCHATGAPA